MLLRNFIIAAQFTAAPGFSSGASPPKLAITFNESGKSTSTSNPMENHIRKGAELALKAAAQKGTLWINNGESAAQSLEAISKLNQQRPKIVVGMGNSFQALLCADRLDRSVVLISPVATSDEILRKKARIILLSNVNSVQARLLTDELKARMKPKQKILLVEVAGCSYCTDMADAIRAALESKNLRPQIMKIHTTQLTDNPKELSELKNYDHIVLPVFEAEAARLISILYPNNSQATFWGGDGWGTLARYVRELPFAKNLQALWLSHYHSSIATKANKKFVRAYRAAYGADPVDTSAFFYESTEMALQLSKEPNARAIMNRFAKMGSYQGLTGEVRTVSEHVIRAMPLMTLAWGQPQMLKLLHPGGTR